MSRTYQTTIPSRAEKHSFIRAAFDHWDALFNAAEAYGPFEGERIPGEAIGIKQMKTFKRIICIDL